jgi:uncharacterized membrane protein
LLAAPRIVTCLFGVGTIAGLILLTEELFHDRTATLLAGVFGAVLPERMILSAVPLAEIMFMFFVVMGMGGIVHYRTTGAARHLFCAGIMFALSSAVRYEGWVFCGMLVAWYVASGWRSRSFRWPEIAGLLLIVGTFPVCWLVLNAREFGDPLAFFSATSARYIRIHGGGTESLLRNNVLSQLVLITLCTGNIIGILGVWHSRLMNPAARSVLLLAGISLLVLAVQMMMAKGMPTHGFWRIAAVWSVLLVPFTARVISTGLAQRRAVLRWAGLGAMVAILSLSLRQAYAQTEISALSRDEIAAGEFLRNELNNHAGETVLIESVIWSYTNVMVASHNPERFLMNSGFDPLAHEPPYLRTDVPLTKEVLSSRKIGFLVFRMEEYIDQLSSTQFVRLSARFGPWYVFEVL